MDAAFLFYLSSDESDCDERIVRRQLRDRSNPLAMSNTAFVKRFRLNKEAFQYVLSQIKFQCHQSTAIPPVLQLAATLSLLASGGYQHSIGSDYLLGMCQSSVSKITSSVIKDMESKLCPNLIKFLPENSSRCKEWFMDKYKIPGVVGCVDGTHIGLQKPTENEHMYFNRKGFHSLNAMIICDHENYITAINCKYGGAAHDSFIWKHSEERRFLEEQFLLNRNANSWLLADSGYPLEPWCITPYRNPQDGSSETVFNDVHSKARCIIERTIGILKGRWKVLGYEKRGRYHPIKVARFANICAALHNICIKFRIPFNPQNTALSSAPDIDIDIETHFTRIGHTIREHIKCSLLN